METEPTGQEALRQAREYRRLGHLARAIALARTVPPSDPGFAEARLLLLRCLLDQGRVLAADAAGAEALPLLPPGAEAEQLRLLHAFILLFSRKDPEPLRTACRSALEAPEVDGRVRALAMDLQARLVGIEVAMLLRPEAELVEAIEGMGRAAEAYAASGSPEEARAARARQAMLFRQGSHPQLDAAQRRWTELRERASAEGDDVSEAQARLALAELEFEATWARPEAVTDGEALVAPFREAASAYVRAGHALGEAQVSLSLGKLLLKYAVPDGEGLLREALELFTREEFVSGQQEALRALVIWHSHRGDAREALQVSERLRALDASEGSPMGEATTLMGLADSALRRGEFIRARELLEEAERRAGQAWQGAGVWLQLALAESAMGLHARAEATCREVVSRLERLGPQPMLSQAYFVWGHVVQERDVAGAIALWEKALCVDEALGDAVAQAQKLVNIAWAQVQQRRAQGKAPLLTPDIERRFERASAVLLPRRELEARVVLGNLYTQRAQAEFLAEHWQDCGNWLTLAEELARTLGLKMQLAFVLSQQGLVLVQVGRSGAPHAWSEASRRFEEAHAFFERESMLDMQWRLLFYQGLADLEAGLKATLTGEEQQRLWGRAREALEAASERIDLLRGNVAERNPLEAQANRMALAVGKEQVYGLGFDLHLSVLRDSAGALLWLERMKGRALLDALAESRLPEPSIPDAALADRERWLREARARASTESESIALGRELHTVWEAMASFPEAASYVALRRGRPVEWRSLRSLLAEEGSRPEAGGQRVVTAHYHCTPGQTLLFVGRADLEQPEVVRIPLDHGRLGRFVRMHFGRTRRVREMLEDGHEPEWQAFSSLVEPLSRWSQRGDVLYLIPHGLLHHLPLHTLLVEGVPLAERNRVAYSPSASALQVCLSRHRRWEARGQARPRAAVFGDSRGASPAERLPRSREEALALEQQLGVPPLLGEAVTRDAFARAAETAELIHFAGHGDLAAEDGLESGLRLAAGDVLRAREVFSLRMNPDLVTLSGCETGVSEFRSGDELLGLPAAFLYAGAESLLTSQWRVDDASTAFLMREFYARAFGTPALPKAEALRQAMRVTRQQPQWNSFYHWGAFTLAGDWK